MNLSSEPNTDDLAEIFASAGEQSHIETNITNFSDDLAALNDIEAESKRVKTQQGIVVQHRSWSTQEIFHSEPKDLSSPVKMAPNPFLTSSPPPTPSPRKKRKAADLDLGENQLARPPKAQRSYYGINIHQLLEEAAQAEQKDIPKPTAELPTPPSDPATKKSSALLWTEKYRARKFTDLIGDERTHRSVMHWLKRWDPVVFPGSRRPKAISKTKGYLADKLEEKPHKKLLMLAGPPGLGKTTLAHVCAKQAGYEVQEINASDERSGAVVKGRIRDMLGTENVKGVQDSKHSGEAGGGGPTKVRKAGKPVCVVIDEVDGVVTGSGGSGEGGFIKALLDLLTLDQKNSTPLGTLQQAPAARKKQGERFRLLRPLILICNDIYHPSLRPLRQTSHAVEIIHVRKPPVQTLISRLHGIFDKEGVPCEGDGVRRLCEATWGVSNRKEDRGGNGAGEGDMRGIMVVGEWVAGKLRAVNGGSGAVGGASLTRRWVEENVLGDLAHGGGAARGLGRGGPKDIVERVFQEGAGFPKSSSAAAPAVRTPQQHHHHQTSDAGGLRNTASSATEGLKRTASERLRELIDTHGDTDRIITDCFSTYPTHPFQDDTLLSKPDSAYEWLHFHDRLSSAVYTSNEWELAPYLSTPVLAFHHLFASPTRAQYIPVANEDGEAERKDEHAHPFTGTQASWAAHEAEKQNSSLLQSLQSSLSLDVSRLFTSTSDIATDLLPYLVRMLSPNVNPVVVGGGGGSGGNEKGTASVRKSSEQGLVQRAVQAMGATGVRFERTKVSSIDNDGGAGGGGAGPTSYGVQWIYRMEPALDEFALFETGGKGFGEKSSGGGRTRFAVRQVLDQEWSKEELRRAEAARLARFGGGVAQRGNNSSESENEDAASTEKNVLKEPVVIVKRDFFGRPIALPRPGSGHDSQSGSGEGKEKKAEGEGEKKRVWVTYHEGFSNAVRKPVTLAELMKDL